MIMDNKNGILYKNERCIFNKNNDSHLKAGWKKGEESKDVCQSQ